MDLIQEAFEAVRRCDYELLREADNQLCGCASVQDLLTFMVNTGDVEGDETKLKGCIQIMAVAFLAGQQYVTLTLKGMTQ